MLVTIAIPFLNGSLTIRGAIQSVFAQTCDRWELLLVDDGSTDDSLLLARSVQDPRVRVISDGVNRGLVYRLNQATDLAQGELFARMDADDLMHPERLAMQVAYLQGHPEIDLVGSSVYTIDLAGTPVGFRVPHGILGGGLVHPTVTGRTAWFRSHPYDASYPRSEDTELWFRTQRNGKVTVLPEPLLFYREVGCFSLRKYWRSWVSGRRILRRYGPAYRGYCWTCFQLAVSWGKCALYAASCLTGTEDLLVRRRSRCLSGEERQTATHLIAAILATPVPALRSGGFVAAHSAVPPTAGLPT
jgi:glycosyltransferase involved in cell wall biosynthesis